MTRLRQNHQRARKGRSGFMARIVIFTVILFLAVIFGFFGLQDMFDVSGSTPNINDSSSFEPSLSSSLNYLPEISKEDQIIHHKYYSLSYDETNEIPEWVSYQLTRESIQAPNVPRAKRFKDDPLVKTRSAKHSDYSHSGYTRGHMAPAGDMAFNQEAMQESFYMSNMAPQIRAFNNGVWRELEEQVRDWAYDERSLIVTTGPIMKGITEQIGKNKIGVPKGFYKILLNPTENKSIAFLIPHEKTDKRLQDFAVTVDELESKTNLDFHAELMDDVQEELLESSFNINRWKFDNRRYRLRVEKWNKE